MTTLALTAMTAVLLRGAWTDWASARIPNRLILIGMPVALVTAAATGGLAAVPAALAAAVIALVIGFAGFALGAIGGGDAKFLMVAAIAVGLSDLVALLLASGALGGVLALGIVLANRRGIEATVMTLDLAKSAATLGHKGHRGRLGDEGRVTVPYGVAIAGGALICLFTPFADWILR